MGSLSCEPPCRDFPFSRRQGLIQSAAAWHAFRNWFHREFAEFVAELIEGSVVLDSTSFLVLPCGQLRCRLGFEHYLRQLMRATSVRFSISFASTPEGTSQIDRVQGEVRVTKPRYGSGMARFRDVGSGMSGLGRKAEAF